MMHAAYHLHSTGLLKPGRANSPTVMVDQDNNEFALELARLRKSIAIWMLAIEAAAAICRLRICCDYNG